MSGPIHNLNIQQYSLEELLGLFELKCYDISVEDLKRCKKKVLMLHPDKSRLDAKYFLFYKKAFDVIVQFYDNQHKQNREVKPENLAYNPNYGNTNTSTAKQVTKTIKKMSNDGFNDKFNELFENNYVKQESHPEKHEWFREEDNQFKVPEGKISKQRMDETFQQIKQQSNELIKYQGVQNMNQDNSSSNSYYEEDNDSYVTSDPFGKLKFEDLRKVHRDQTVLAVSENDIHNMQTYRNVEEYNQARSQHSYDPMENERANKVLQTQEKTMRDKMMKKEYDAKLEIQRNEVKNQEVLSSFLLLQNKK